MVPAYRVPLCRRVRAWEYAKVGASVEGTNETRVRRTRTPERRLMRMGGLLRLGGMECPREYWFSGSVKWTKLKRGRDSCHDGTSADCSAMAAGRRRCAGNVGAGGRVELQASGSSSVVGCSGRVCRDD